MKPETISARLSSIKTFSRKFVFRYAELTTRDVLDKVERFDPPVRTKAALNPEQLEHVLGCYDESDRYTDVRDRAMLLLFAASGLRFSEVINLKLSEIDKWTGWIKTIQKGDRERAVKVGERALKALRGFLRVRRADAGVDVVFTTEAGRALTYQGGQSSFRRLKKACRSPWMHPHRFRHTWAQNALQKGAERALVQDTMGWTTDRMARRYQGWYVSAAKAMPDVAPV